MVSGKLQHMQSLGHFEQLLCLLEIFQILANSDEVTELNVPAFNLGGFGATLGTYNFKYLNTQVLVTLIT